MKNELSVFREIGIEELRSTNFYIWSDTHFRHRNIVEYCNRPSHHNQLMVNHWWETVKPNDIILHLGDVAMTRGIQELRDENFIKQLPGKKYLILGNHDKPKGVKGATEVKGYYDSMGFTTLDEFVITGYISPHTEKEWNLYFTHRPGGNITPFDDLRIVQGDQKAIVCHGHVHQKSISHPRLINFSVEVTDYRPQWFPTLISDHLRQLEQREIRS